MDKNLPRLMPEINQRLTINSQNTMQDKCQNPTIAKHIIFKWLKFKDKEKILERRHLEKHTLVTEE